MAVAVVVAGSDRFPARSRIGGDQSPPPGIWLVPFISQIAAWPLVFWNRMSEKPSLLKSPVPIAFQLGPGSAASTAPPPDLARSVHLPDRGLAIGVLQQDVGIAVAVEVAGSDRLPARPGVGADRAPPPIGFIPFISQTATCPFAFCHRMSAWPSPLKSPVPMAFQLGPGWRRPWPAAGDLARPVHLPDRGLTVRVLPQDVGMAIAIEVAAGSDGGPARPGIGADRWLPPGIWFVPFSSQIAAWPFGSATGCRNRRRC